MQTARSIPPGNLVNSVQHLRMTRRAASFKSMEAAQEASMTCSTSHPTIAIEALFALSPAPLHKERARCLSPCKQLVRALLCKSPYFGYRSYGSLPTDISINATFALPPASSLRNVLKVSSHRGRAARLSLGKRLQHSREAGHLAGLLAQRLDLDLCGRHDLGRALLHLCQLALVGRCPLALCSLRILWPQPT